MKGNLFLLFVLSMFWMLSCRSETELIEEESKPKRFAVFTEQSIYSKSGTQLDHAKGFAYLAQRYDSIHSTNITGLVNNNKTTWDKKAQQRFIDESTEAYIEFRIHSQLIEVDNGDKWIFYPKIHNQTVIGLVMATLMADGTIVGYHNIDTNGAFYQSVVSYFQEKYNDHFLIDDRNKVNVVFESSRCGFEGEDPCEIEAVTIPTETLTTIDEDYDWQWEAFGICGEFSNCDDYEPAGGGSGSSDSSEQGNDPCEKIMSLRMNAAFNAKFTTLNTDEKLNYNHEIGFSVQYNTAYGDQYQPMSNKPGTSSVRLSDNGNHYGYMHTHNESEFPDYSIRIFSPQDIVTFLTTCVRNAQEYGTISDAYCVVITTEGNYILKYTGDGSYSIGPNQVKNWQTWYEDNYNALIRDAQGEDLEQADVEELFTQFLEEVVNIDGLEVYQLNNDLTSSRLTYNGENNTVKKENCTTN